MLLIVLGDASGPIDDDIGVASQSDAVSSKSSHDNNDNRDGTYEEDDERGDV